MLIDAFRSPAAGPAELSRQFARAGQHLPKLIYAQIADYLIASQTELLAAVERHRPQLHLDGPNDFDWIFANELISERERMLYVDLIEDEDGLDWLAPNSEACAVRSKVPIDRPGHCYPVDGLCNRAGPPSIARSLG